MDVMEQLDYMPFDPTIKSSEGTVKDKKTGEGYKTSKGAPHVLLKLVQDAGGFDKALAAKIEKDVTELGKRGIRAIAVAKIDRLEGGGQPHRGVRQTSCQSSPQCIPP